LGADNGLGVASIMAVLAASDIAHPPIEALFTIDEETGMTGAKELQAGVLTGDVMLNLDTDDDDELTIGCAGGVDVVTTGTYAADATPSDHQGFQITLRGLTGGHSGMDIHLGRGNANKIINRILMLASQHNSARLVSIDGGGLRNAIPRESVATVLVPNGASLPDQSWFQETSAAIKDEHATTDPNLEIVCEPVDVSSEPVAESFQQNLFTARCGVANGIHRMSPDFAGLVQTSNNLARVLVQDGKFSIDCLTRSSINSERHAFADSIATVLMITGGTVEKTGDYPGWQPKPDAPIVQLMKSLYEETFGESPKVSAGHGGLECGLLGQNYPDMQMISFGPTIRGAHSPDEKASISSMQKFWKLFVATLDRI
jgi:dipeptidase D